MARPKRADWERRARAVGIPNVGWYNVPELRAAVLAAESRENHPVVSAKRPVCRNCSQPCHPDAAYCCDQCALQPGHHSLNCPKGCTRREATVADLEVGDIFDWPDGAWHGPSRLTEISHVGHDGAYSKATYHIVGENYRVVNPPMVSFDKSDRKVVIFDV